MFSNAQLKKLIIPLILEQLLAVTVGMADVMMVSQAGQEATSGVSLVDIISVLLVLVFSSMATGGAVVASNYIGQKRESMACRSANQLILVTVSAGLLIMTVCLFGKTAILDLIYGQVEPTVRQNAITYFTITAVSYPFLALYNGAAALCRAMGDSKTSLKASLVMNAVNVAGNALLVLVFRLGVVGVAVPTLVSRIVAAVIMFFIIRNQGRQIHIDRYCRLGFDGKIIREILRIGIPTGIDGGFFQLGKILVASLVSTLGTSAITANAVGNTIASFQCIPGSAMQLALTTIVGQCLGAKETDQAISYTKRLMKYTYVSMGALNICLLLALPLILGLYNLLPETYDMAYTIMMIHGIGAILIWPLAFTLPAALRAGGDPRYVMLVSAASMWTFRVLCSYFFVNTLHWGLAGVWGAMTIDWICRAGLFVWRFYSRKWIKMVPLDR